MAEWKRFWAFHRRFRRFCIACLMLLCALVSTVLFLQIRKAEAEVRQLEALKAKAAPYEQELDRLRLSLHGAQGDAEAASPEPTLVIAFFTDDLTRIPMDRGFRPVLLIDKPIQTELETVSVGNAVPGRYALERNREEEAVLLPEAGYRVILRYVDECEPHCENGVTFLNYSVVRTNSFDVSDRLRETIRQRQNLVFVFDLFDISDDAMERNLAEIESRVQDGLAEYTTVAEAAKALSAADQAEDLRQKEKEAAEAQTMARIAELQEIIREIYSEWDEAHNR